MGLKGSKTEKNILTAFAGESQARNRYTYFVSKAREEGYVQIADIFEETANQEKEHAKRFFNLLEGGDVTVQAAFPAGVIGTTASNLKAAAAGEHYEWTEMYPSFAKIAQEKTSATSQRYSSPSLSPKNSTKDGTSGFCPMLKLARCSKKKKPLSGGVGIVVICKKGKRPLRPVLPAPIPGHTMSFWLRIGKT